jgi:hypothetical protein
MQRYKEDFQFFALHSVENVEFRVSLLLRDFEKKHLLCFVRPPIIADPALPHEQLIQPGTTIS